jgi:hypothetical protein
MNNIEHPITEWRHITKSQLLARINNTPYLNELDILNSGDIFVKFNSTETPLDKPDRILVKTYIGTDCVHRYFIVNFSGEFNLPEKNGNLIILIPNEKNIILPNQVVSPNNTISDKLLDNNNSNNSDNKNSTTKAKNTFKFSEINTESLSVWMIIILLAIITVFLVVSLLMKK